MSIETKIESNDELVNLISILDTAITSNKRRSIGPVLILLEHYINEYHSEETAIKLKIDQRGHRLEEANYSLFSKKLTDIKNGFSQNKPTAHLIFSIRNLIEDLAQKTSISLVNTTEDSTALPKVDPKEVFKDYLANHEGRITKTKLHLIDEIFKLNDHFEVEDFLDSLSNQPTKISRATVYRTIKQLLEAGLLQKITTNQEKCFYEKSSPEKEHAHLICNNCGKLLEIKDSKIRGLLEQYCKNEF